MSVPIIGERYQSVLTMMEYEGATLTSACEAVKMSPQAFHVACSRNEKLKQAYQEMKAAKAASLHEKIGEVSGKIVDESAISEDVNPQKLKVAFDMGKWYAGTVDEQYRLNGSTQAVQVNVFQDLMGEPQGFGDILETQFASQSPNQVTPDDGGQE